MRVEYNNTKISMGHFSTIRENDFWKIQLAQGRFFNEKEYVLWNIEQKCFAQNEDSGVIIFQDIEEAIAYSLSDTIPYEREEIK